MTATTCDLVAPGASAAFDSRINVYAGTCGDLACIVSSDDHGGCAGGQSAASWCSTAGQTYFILVHNLDEEGGAFNLAVVDAGACAPPVNNECDAALPLEVNAPQPGTTAWADGGNPSQPGCPRHDRGVWYTFAPEPEQEYTVTVTGATVNTSVAVFAGCGGPEIEDGNGSGRALCRDLPETNDTQTAVFAVGEDVPTIAIRVASGPEAASGNAGSGDEIGGDFVIEVAANLPTGACCTPTGCIVATAPECSAAGGTYQGHGSACTDGVPAGNPVQFGPNFPALPIPDLQAVEDTITVAGVGAPVGAVTVTVNINHAWIEDLEIDLIHEATGVTVRLFGDQCGDNSNLFVTFDDAGGEVLCATPITGTIVPFSPLSAFRGVAADGDWTLRVFDDFEEITGTLNSWSLTIDELTGGTCGPVAGCPCEFDNNTAQVNVFDLLAYLDLWFAGDEGAELDGQDGIDVFDLLGFLDCWFPASAGEC
jgi:hypothetical protein